MTDELNVEFIEEDDASLEADEVKTFSDAVLYSTDWTVGTIINQLERNNIEMNPKFQRRDAWSTRQKSNFIESIILGLPIPQIILAERKEARGRFIVLDGKQRLLALLQFRGSESKGIKGFSLSSLEARPDLTKKRYSQLAKNAEFLDDLNQFENHTIRTVIIRNWPSMDFLHLVFLRLNTGSVKLSPQELRQAIVPGEFSNYVDDASASSNEIQLLLGRTSPDPRMRDVELLVRYLSFRNYLSKYFGRMKSFLDESCIKFNQDWELEDDVIRGQFEDFKSGISVLIEIFGPKNVARKKTSNSFNRAIFDSLIFYASDERIRSSMLERMSEVRVAYDEILNDARFMEAVESDTAGVPHTFDRLRLWGEKLRHLSGQDFNLPNLIDLGDRRRIEFGRFW